MFSNETLELLDAISRNVEAVGRQIRSPKTDLDDLRTLAQTLEISKATIESIYLTELSHLT